MPLPVSTPLSLYSIPIVWAVGYYPVAIRSRIVQKAIVFNNLDPRGNIARLEQKKVDPKIITKASRLENSHKNGLEAFPFWSIAVLAGNFAKLDHQTLNTMALAFIVLRVSYNEIYSNQQTRAHSYARTVVWILGMTLPLYILIASANAVRLQ